MTNILMPLVVALAFGLSPAVYAQNYVPLYDYIETVNNAEVSFEGHAKYDSSEDRFTFYDSEGRPYRMSMDAGRKAREKVQQICENSGFMVSRSDLCVFAANGTLEIVGGRLQLSVDEVLKVVK